MKLLLCWFFVLRRPRLTQVTQQFAKIESQIEQERKRDKRRELLNRKRKTS